MANLELTVHNCQPQLIAVEKSGKKAMKEVEDSRRDEWSTEAINNLLDVYEAKWNHRNRGNLKGGDWEDVAMRVSARGGGGKSSKSPFQCKNKVASMKQKYRSETLLQNINGSTTSRWPFFPRMDVMLRVPGRANNGNPAGGAVPTGIQAAVTDLRLQEALQSGDSEQEVMRIGGLSNGEQPEQKPESHSNNNNNNNNNNTNNNNMHENIDNDDGDGDNQDDASNTLPQRKPVGVVAGESDETSTPRSKSAHLQAGGTSKPSAKHRKHLSKEVAASIRSFADSILKLEKAKMEMFKDSERLRAEMEARRVDMELKRTEIIMNTQLEIAKLLSGKIKKKKFKKKSTQDPPAPAPVSATSVPAASSPSKNGVVMNVVPLSSMPCQSIGDYVSNGSHSNNVQQSYHHQSQMSAMQTSSHTGPRFVPTSVPVSVVQPIPALQFMPAATSQPKPG
eukprot:Gb_06471 [translate_table: standard]